DTHTHTHTHTGLGPTEGGDTGRSEEHTSELQSHLNLVCRLLLEKKTQTRTHTLAQSVTRSHAYTLTHAHTHTQARTVPHITTQPPPNTHTHTLTHTFFFNDTATPEIYTLSLHDSLPI